jgi:hypothetical protein
MQRCSCKIIVSGKVVNEQQQLRNVTEWIDCAYTVSTLGGGGGNGGVDEVATVSTYRSLGGGADQADGERKSQSFFFLRSRKSLSGHGYRSPCEQAQSMVCGPNP